MRSTNAGGKLDGCFLDAITRIHTDTHARTHEVDVPKPPQNTRTEVFEDLKGRKYRSPPSPTSLQPRARG